MGYFVKGTQTRLVGTLELLRGVVAVLGKDAEGNPVFSDHTDIWDEQHTARDPLGNRLWIDENEATYPEFKVEWRADH